MIEVCIFWRASRYLSILTKNMAYTGLFGGLSTDLLNSSNSMRFGGQR